MFFVLGFGVGCIGFGTFWVLIGSDHGFIHCLTKFCFLLMMWLRFELGAWNNCIKISRTSGVPVPSVSKSQGKTNINSVLYTVYPIISTGILQPSTEADLSNELRRCC